MEYLQRLEWIVRTKQRLQVYEKQLLDVEGEHRAQSLQGRCYNMLRFELVKLPMVERQDLSLDDDDSAQGVG